MENREIFARSLLGTLLISAVHFNPIPIFTCFIIIWEPGTFFGFNEKGLHSGISIWRICGENCLKEKNFWKNELFISQCIIFTHKLIKLYLYVMSLISLKENVLSKNESFNFPYLIWHRRKDNILLIIVFVSMWYILSILFFYFETICEYFCTTDQSYYNGANEISITKLNYFYSVLYCNWWWFFIREISLLSIDIMLLFFCWFMMQNFININIK